MGCLGGLVERLTSAQVMISQFVSSSPALGSLLSRKSPLRIPSPSLSAPAPAQACTLCIKIKHLKNKK